MGPVDRLCDSSDVLLADQLVSATEPLGGTVGKELV